MNNDKSLTHEVKSAWPALLIGTVVVAGIALVGRLKTEGGLTAEQAGTGINKRKNFMDFQRADYGYPSVPLI